MSRRRGRGFTLVELLVALAIFSVLGVLSYRALASIVDSRDRLAVEQKRWQQVTRFVQRLELDLQQVALGQPDAVSYDADRQTLRLIRLVGAASGDEVRTIRYRYRWRDGRVERDERRLLPPAPASDTAELVAPDLLLDGVQSFDWSASEGGAALAWQPLAATAGRLPPVAIRLRFKLAELTGEVERVVVLR